MKTLNKNITSTFFNKPSDYHEMIKRWSDLVNSQKGKNLTAKDHLYYLVLKGKNWLLPSAGLIRILNMPDSKRISIIIVNYRSEQHLPVCLASVYSRLEKQSESEVLVVNNDERGKITFIASQFPQVKIIEAGKNIGYGPASNLGARAATGRILFFLNPDAEIISPDILTLCRELERNPETAILGTRLVGAKGENQWWNAGVDITPCDTLLNNLKIKIS